MGEPWVPSRPMTWQFVLTGLLIGVLVGMTGMGGGSLMTPILVIVFGFQPTLAVGTDILHGAIFKTAGALRHRRLGTVHHQLSGWMFVGSAPFSLLGVAVATRITHRYGDSATEVMGYILGGALLFGAVGLVLKSFVRKKAIGRRRPLRHGMARPLRRDRDRHRRRLHRRPHLGRQRDVLRADDAVRLPAQRAQGRRHRHPPRSRAALRRRLRPLHRRATSTSTRSAGC